MAKALLLAPTYRNRPSVHMPHSLLAVAAVLRSRGHEVQILDSHLYKYSPQQAIYAIEELDFDILGITGIFTSYYFWKMFVPLFRQRYGRDIPIMAGGSVACMMPEMFLTEVDADAICMGDAEPVIGQLAEYLIAGKELDDLGGIGFRRNGELVIKPGLFVEDMDKEVLMPAYDLINMDDYREYRGPGSKIWNYIDSQREDKKVLEFRIFSSRGCPYNCTFCCKKFKRRFVQHSTDRFIEHMAFVAKEYAPDMFCITDELMTLRRDWALDFCEKYKNSGIDIPYRLPARVDTVDKELLLALKDSGCSELDFGIESGSPTILKEMKKGATVEQNRQALRAAKEVGLFPNVAIVLGMPGETLETIQETKNFLIEEDVKTAGIFFATALPGSALYDHAVSRGMIPDLDEYMLKIDTTSRLVLNFTTLSDVVLEKKMDEILNDMKRAWHQKRGMSGWQWQWMLFKERIEQVRTVLRTQGLFVVLKKIIKKVKQRIT